MVAIKDQSGGVAPAGPAAKVRGVLPSEDFTFSLTPSNTQISGSSSGQTTIADSVYNTSTGATVDQTSNIQVSVPFASPFPYMTPTLTNNTPGVCSVTQAGVTTRVADGAASIDITVPGRTKKRASFPVLRAGGQTSNVFANFATGSLGKALADDIASRLAGKTPSPTTQNIFSVMNDQSRTYTRNPSFWAAGADLTCIPAACGNTANNSGWYNGILVTPRHLLVCQHATTSGDLYFVDAGSGVTKRTIAGGYAIPQGAGNASNANAWDMHLYALASDVPAGINFAKVLPNTFRHNLFMPANGFPAVFCNQFKQLGVVDATSFSVNGTYTIAQTDKPADAARSAWFIPGVNHDSGGAVGFIVNGALVLMSQVEGLDAAGGPFGPVDSDCIAEINAGIAALDAALSAVTGYTLTTLDLSGYPSY